MKIGDNIKEHANDFADMRKDHKMNQLYAFGSSITEHFDAKRSDIDLLVELNAVDPIEQRECLLDLWDKFELFFKRKVDLLTEASIKNPILRSNINRTKFLIYDGKRQKVLI